MNVKERIISIILEEKVKQNPKYAEKIGIEILHNKQERKEKQK